MAIATLKRSDGKTFAYGDIFRIMSYGLIGVGTLSVEIFSENKAIGDGDVVTGQRLPPRTIQIQAVCISRAANTYARAVANDFFNPSYEYELHLDYKGSKAWIPCLLDVYDLPTENIHAKQALNISLFCPDPYFLSESSFGKNIAQVQGMAGFPYCEHPRLGRVASVYNFSQSVVIVNDGDAGAYPIVEISARREVRNPKIIKDGLFVQIGTDAQPYIMPARDTVVVDFDAKTVTKNPIKHSEPHRTYFTGGENIIQQVSKDSSLTTIVFEVGANTISYGAASGENVMNCTIYYNERYVGV